ncbi:unnamed protein product [Chilo suppressalis]|uniref:ZP domain-containing protein n=1 Tax=Chilo suppressalis TaxID=168631 RepID=A0ABN8BDB2_CHISP|nr:unnamed protein product [Chilo suppressalis]
MVSDHRRPWTLATPGVSQMRCRPLRKEYAHFLKVFGSYWSGNTAGDNIFHSYVVRGSESRMECTQEVMRVTVPMDGDRKVSYLDQMKDYVPCQPSLEENNAIFVLDLQDPHKCGVTRVLNKLTGKRTYYHKVVVESADGDRETQLVRCVVAGKSRTLTRREVQPFPLDFNEPDVLNITRDEEGRAPEPMLFAAIKKNGVPVPKNDSVSPGTHLSMEIFLDNTSAPIYGLFVNYMYATNTENQQETIILNGCSVDASLFNNFQTTDGDLLVAKFRAFKFPDTTYVLFIGTVTVCLDTCPGVQCSNGVRGYGRRRRAVPSSHAANMYEVSLTTFLQVDWKDGDREAEDVLALIKNLKAANQMLESQDDTTASTTNEINELFPLKPELTGKASTFAYSTLTLAISLFLILMK